MKYNNYLFGLLKYGREDDDHSGHELVHSEIPNVFFYNRVGDIVYLDLFGLNLYRRVGDTVSYFGLPSYKRRIK